MTDKQASDVQRLQLSCPGLCGDESGDDDAFCPRPFFPGGLSGSRSEAFCARSASEACQKWLRHAG